MLHTVCIVRSRLDVLEQTSVKFEKNITTLVKLDLKKVDEYSFGVQRICYYPIFGGIYISIFPT